MHALSPRRRSARTVWLVRALSVCLAIVTLAPAASAASNPKYAGLVVDAITGKDLYEDRADEYRYPASLTKIMTLYIVFEELKAGRLTLDSKLTMSEYAAARPPSKIGFKPGGTIAVRDAIKALVTKSANDVATGIGENISGSEAAFAKRMTATAKRLGMTKTTYRNASGLPHPGQKTTARDQARLGLAIQRDFPQYYGVFQTRVFEYGKRRYGNHNRLLGRVEGVDGIKTGYIRASGFNLVTSVRRDGRHIVAVVMGGRTGASRNKHMTDLVERTLPKAKAGQPLVFAAWSDSGPAPIPLARPSMAVRFAARLKTREEEQDEITTDPIQTILAFATQTRASAGVPAGAATGAAIVPSPASVKAAPASDALRAVIEDEITTPPVAAEPLPGTASPQAVATIELASADDAASAASALAGAADPVTDDTRLAYAVEGQPTVAAPVRSAEAGPRFAAAFDVFGGSATSGELAGAFARRMVPTSGITVIAMGSAPQTVGEHAPRDPASAKIDARLSAEGLAVAAPKAPQSATAAPREPQGLRTGWQIQLGAVDSESAAEGILTEAIEDEPAMAQQARVLIPVTTPKGTIYRARLGGFRSEAEALSACKRFTNHNRPCWAVSM